MKIIHTRHLNNDKKLLESAKNRGFYRGNFAMDDEDIIAMILDVVIIRNQNDLFNPTDDYYSEEVDEEIDCGNVPIVCALLNYQGGHSYLWPIDYLKIP